MWNDDLFTEMVFWFALGVVVLMALWIGLDYSIREMRETWQAMEGREWRWPEGTNGVYGPGDEPHHRRAKIPVAKMSKGEKHGERT